MNGLEFLMWIVSEPLVCPILPLRKAGNVLKKQGMRNIVVVINAIS